MDTAGSRVLDEDAHPRLSLTLAAHIPSIRQADPAAQVHEYWCLRLPPENWAARGIEIDVCGVAAAFCPR
jgi:hypothetical protein